MRKMPTIAAANAKIKNGANVAETLAQLRAKRKLMYGNGANQFVWLVWEMSRGKPTLAVICSTDDDLYRYVSRDRKSRLGDDGKNQPVFVEKVMLDHWYGANDARIAVNIIRNER